MFEQETSQPSNTPVEDIFAGTETAKVSDSAASGLPSTPTVSPLSATSISGGGTKARGWLLAVVGLLVIASLAAAGYWWWQRSDENTQFSSSPAGSNSLPGLDLNDTANTQTPGPETTNQPTEPVDTDGDGLSGSEEATLGTDPLKADTDGDGLFDREESKIYGTDPLKADTDGDTFSDGTEVKNGYNPKGDGRLLELPPANNQ
jgi:hypothetical protein